jgi:hypothetical protein
MDIDINKTIRCLVAHAQHDEDCDVVPCGCGLSEAKSNLAIFMSCMPDPATVARLTADRDAIASTLAALRRSTGEALETMERDRETLRKEAEEAHTGVARVTEELDDALAGLARSGRALKDAESGRDGLALVLRSIWPLFVSVCDSPEKVREWVRREHGDQAAEAVYRVIGDGPRG